MVKIIAEIGWNHMGDMDLAKKMIKEASDNGADYCKFQTWSVKNLTSGPWDLDGRREIYEKAELSEKDHIQLRNYCLENNTKFMTSVFNVEDIEFLKNLDSSVIKIPSHEVYNTELIDQACNYFDQVLISTGASKWKEIESINSSFKKYRPVLMHCVSSYPCELSKINFLRLEKLKKINKKVGYSGHYPGIDDAIVAISKDIQFVEKHFTIDKDLPGRDNKFAILPNELKQISKFRDNFNKMNIYHGLDLQDCEKDTYENYRGRWSGIAEEK